MRAIRDPRFIIGVLLIVIGVGAGAWVIDRDRSEGEYYLLTRDVAAGQRLTEADLHVVKATLPSKEYVRRGDLPDPAYAGQQLIKGELLSTHAAATQPQEQQILVVSLAQPLPATTRIGDNVALYRSGNLTDALQKSELLTARAQVYSLPTANQVDSTTRVEVAVPLTDVPTVVAAQGERNSLIGVLTHQAAASNITRK